MKKTLELINSKKNYEGVTLTKRMKKYHIPAISIALIENFEISETYVYGVKQRKTGESITPDTLFQAASISKPVFAVAIMRLVACGILDIDADISEYLVDYEIPTFDKQKHKITLRQLLSHRAGLNLHGFTGYRQGKKLPTVNEMLTGAKPANHSKLELEQKPCTEEKYSGGGYVLAQKIMTDVCKNDFCELMSDLILRSLSMEKSTFSQPLPKDKFNEIAMGHTHFSLQLLGGFRVMPELSAAGLWSTPSDLARFGIEMMKSLNGKSTFLDRKTAELMMAKADVNANFGIGFKVNTSEKGLVFEHSGSNFGYLSNMCFCPAEGSGIVIMLNSDRGKKVLFEVTNAFKEMNQLS